MNPSHGPMVSTYQTRIADYGDVEPIEGEGALAAYAELYGRVQRKLFADFSAGELPASLKKVYLQRYGIPARMFNGLRVSLEGKVSAVQKTMGLRRDSLQRRISRAEREVDKAVKGGRRDQVHQKGRRLANLKSRLAGLEADVAAGRVRICFGSKRLWRKQHDLEVNGYGSHEEWLVDWRESRSDEFFVLGSRDETAGCQLCVAAVADDGTLTLRLRMPDWLAERHGKYLSIENVRFAYGHDQVLAALQSNAEYTRYRREHGEKEARSTNLGQAISYRFKRVGRGWRVFVSTRMMDVPVVTDQRRGAIGVDLNADHLAVAETDASGNCLNAWRVPLATYGKSTHQAEALIGDGVASVVEYASNAGKPIVMERLDFRQKKAISEGQSRKYSRMLSSFSYGKVKAYFISRGYREGVEVHQVNPAFGSVIGRVKFMERYGLSVHQAAALVLARRLLGCSERIPRQRVAPVDNGVHVAFTVPARKRVKHVWTYWGAISGQLDQRLQRSTGWIGGNADPIRLRLVRRCRPAEWLELGSDRCSRVRSPGGAVLYCWDGGAAKTASSAKADGSPATKVNHFYNGSINMDKQDGQDWRIGSGDWMTSRCRVQSRFGFRGARAVATGTPSAGAD